MICPKCGAKIKEDLLYCSKCGEEIHFVPDFEPEIENSIQETLSELQFLDEEGEFESAETQYLDVDNTNESNVDDFEDDYFEDEFDEEYDGDLFDDEFDEEAHVFKQILKSIHESKLKWVIIAVAVLIIGLIITGVIVVSRSVYQNNSYTYQAQLAQEAAANGDYTLAISHMERALILNSDDTSMKYQLADYYFTNQENEKGILMLWEIIYEKDVNYQAAYEKMINYYASIEDYAMIEEILSNCDDQTVVGKFQNYMANEPEFSEPEGTYDEVVPLKLSSNANGTIYYTIDGTMPTKESTVYTQPIYLELGIYEINAIFINSYGIESDVVSKVYTIDIKVPNPPTVLLESGEFDTPELIEVEVQQFCTVYYTTDGTPPTNESTEYLGPIPMPIGTSHFTFVAYSQEGINGEYTECEYNLTLESNVQVQDIINQIKQYNLNTGKATDIMGHLPGNSMRYTYVVSSAINLDGVIYYIIVENMVDTSENSMKTGTYYLVDISTGSIYKAIKNEDQSYTRSELVPPEAYAVPVPIVVSGNAVGSDGQPLPQPQ